MPISRIRLKLALAAALLLAPGLAVAQSCTPVAAVKPEALVTPGKLQLSINPTLPPQQFVDSKGELQGLNVELGRAIAAKLCLEMSFVRMDFPPMIPALQAGRFDGIHTGMFWTEERAKLFALVPYSLQAISIAVPANGSLQISAPDDLAGCLATLVAETGGMTRTALERLGGAPSAMAFRDRSVAEAVAKALTALREDGTYTKLFERFGLTPLPADQVFGIRGPSAS